MERAYGLEVPRTLEDVCDPRRLALLVYDMQVGIVEQVPDPQATIARVRQVLGAAREAGVRTFFSRHLSLPKELMGVSQHRTAMAWQRVNRVADTRSLFLRDSPGLQLIPELQPLSSEAIFDRLSMSFFAGTPLDMALRDCGIVAFAIVGLVLEIGIEPTVSHGADLGYVPIVVADACGSVEQDARERALASAAGQHRLYPVLARHRRRDVLSASARGAGPGPCISLERTGAHAIRRTAAGVLESPRPGVAPPVCLQSASAVQVTPPEPSGGVNDAAQRVEPVAPVHLGRDLDASCGPVAEPLFRGCPA